MDDSKPFSTFLSKCGSGAKEASIEQKELLSPDDDGNVECVRLHTVCEGSPACLAGVCVGDVVVAVDERPLVSFMIDPHDPLELGSIINSAGIVCFWVCRRGVCLCVGCALFNGDLFAFQ